MYMYNTLCVSFMQYATLCHAMSWQGTCACKRDGHVLTTTQTEYSYGMGCASTVQLTLEVHGASLGLFRALD